MRSPSPLARQALRHLALIAIMLFATSTALAGCADIHPDNTPFSPHGRGR
ncbi:MAG TPA: hypothetical protein VKQ29_07025 [Aliidongia sp.]|nr:hypothetical protein [Aliidongia sp.]